MATILEEGKAHLVPKYKPHRCTTCTSLIQYHTDDIKSSPRGESYVICPVCQHTLDSSCLKKTPSYIPTSRPIDFEKTC